MLVSSAAQEPGGGERQRKRRRSKGGKRMESSSEVRYGAGEQEQVLEMVQSVIVMRHGDRVDMAEPLWVSTALRPWDPPLTDAGRMRAWSTGRKLRKLALRPLLARAFVSPFLRCIQTASEAVAALCALHDSDLAETSDNAPIDPSKLKVSIEYGLCEILNTNAIREDLAPTDGNWTLELSELEAMLPAGTVDSSVDQVYKELPKWQEGMLEARTRYEQVITELANRHPKENLLLVTHGEGVGVAVSAFLENALVYDVEYCGYAHLQRRITFHPNGRYTAQKFKLLTENGRTGVCWQDC